MILLNKNCHLLTFIKWNSRLNQGCAYKNIPKYLLSKNFNFFKLSYRLNQRCDWMYTNN